MRMGSRGRVTAGRYRVEAARMPGMAARDAPDAEPAAAQHAEPIDGLEGVLGACRMESATGAEQRTDRPLITTDQPGCEAAHRSITCCHSAARLACSSVPGTPRAFGRALTTR